MNAVTRPVANRSIIIRPSEHRVMKTKTIAAATLVALLLTVVAATAYATAAGHPSDPSARGHDDDNNQGDEGAHLAACNNLTSGETLTVSGLTGHYLNASDRDMGGNASGTFTFKVTGIFAVGCTLSLTGGSFTLNSTTYTITGGSIVLNHGGRSGEGSGTTTSGSFIIFVAGLHGNSTSANVGAIHLDFETGTNQFLVHLHSPAAASDAEEDS